MRFFISLLILLTFSLTTYAQTGTALGIKGGLTAGNQSWSGSDREYLLAYNGSIFLESIYRTKCTQTVYTSTV